MKLKTRHEIQASSDTGISEKDFVDKLEQHTTHPVTDSHKAGTTKNASQYIEIPADP